MSQYFLLALNAVLPFILYMSFGYATVHFFRITDGGFLNKLNSMVFKCFFPLLMFNNFCSMDLSDGFNLGPMFFCVAAVLVLTAGLVLTVPLCSKDNSRRGVIIQALYRSNSILFALPLSESVFGAAGVAASSKLVAVVVPLFNVISVVILEYYRGNRPTFLSLLIRILTNPLILGAIAGGLVLVFLRVQLPVFIAKPVKALADMTTPLSLFILGGTLRFASVKKDARALGVSLLFKLLLIPAVVVFLLRFFNFEPWENFAIFCFFATPVAVSSYSMAANMGGDKDLAGEFVAFSTVISLFTIFFWIVLLKTLGVI